MCSERKTANTANVAASGIMKEETVVNLLLENLMLNNLDDQYEQQRMWQHFENNEKALVIVGEEKSQLSSVAALH